jgi:LppP/LprE lipoprotein
MRSESLRSIALLLIAVVFGGSAGAQTPAGNWLDSSSVTAWNRAGTPIPYAPERQNPDPRCRGLVRSPQSDEDRHLRTHGWDLVGPATAAKDIQVIAATADYDGMCRPRQYQSFVFAHGVFVGTLSPHLMDSRTDGALSQVTIESERKLRAKYLRYAATDPLCCASRTTTVTFAIDADPPAIRALSATTVANSSPQAP